MTNTLMFFLLHFRKGQDPGRIVFSITTEFNKEVSGIYGRLKRNTNYSYYYRDGQIQFNSYEIEKLISETISYEAPGEINKLFGYKPEIVMIDVQEGSIEETFVIILSGALAFSRYKNLVESWQLLKKQINRLIGRRIAESFPNAPFNVTINLESPTYGFPSSPTHQVVPIRDGLFYFLLVGFFVLLAIFGIFVFHAFSRTYFN